MVSGIETLVLILGVRRSGTTLLNNLLCRGPGGHPHLAEAQPLTRLLEALAWCEANYQTISADFFADAADFNTFGREICDAFIEHAGRACGEPQRLILKNPELSLHTSKLLEFWPNAHVIACVRDPRDQVASEVLVEQRRAGGEFPVSKEQIERLCATYSDYLDPVLAADRAAPGRIQFVRYEDVVREPKATAQAVARRCGFELSVSHTEHWPDERNLLARSAHLPAFVPLYGKPVTDERVGAGARLLTPEAISLIEKTLAPHFTRFGYERGAAS